MSGLAGRVGGWEIRWKSAPRGNEGTAIAEVREKSGAKSREIEVRWRRDADGLWMELPGRVAGFDIDGTPSDEGGLVYLASRRGSNEAYAGLSFVRAGDAASAAGASGAKKITRVRAQMPGKMIRVLVKAGDAVAKDQSLAVMEAMKMENEIRAPQAGRIGKLSITVGQAVESGADLMTIEPSDA